MTARIARRQCKKCGKNRQLSSFVGDRGRTCATCRKATGRASARRGHLFKTYGLTQDEYDAILAEQGGVCAVCKGKRPYNLAVDHNHSMAQVAHIRCSIRGLLCKRCNKVLRDIRDSNIMLWQLDVYLKDPPAQRVLGLPQLDEQPAD